MEQYLASSWIARSLVDCSNIVQANLNAHKWNGIALVALTLIHVWSILLPRVVHRWSAQVVPGIFEYPLSERTPPGFQDANNETKTMSLQVDDVFRMVEMTLLLGVLTPLTATISIPDSRPARAAGESNSTCQLVAPSPAHRRERSTKTSRLPAKS